MDIDKVKAADKLKAAAHEAGHLTVGLACGIACSAWLYPSEEPVDLWTERGWCGSTERYYSTERIPAMGVAGVVAECLLENEDYDAEEIADWIDWGTIEPSESDWRNLERTPEAIFPATEQAVRLLREHAEFWRWATRELVENEYVSERQAKEWFRELEV
jgi:hypothetical protein